jgi:hypothetical protein
MANTHELNLASHLIDIVQRLALFAEASSLKTQQDRGGKLLRGHRRVAWHVAAKVAHMMSAAMCFRDCPALDIGKCSGGKGRQCHSDRQFRTESHEFAFPGTRPNDRAFLRPE